MKWSFLSFFRTNRPAQRKRYATLGVEPLEDRLVLASATPSFDARTITETQAEALVATYRQTMSTTAAQALPANFVPDLGLEPMAFKWQGNLVIYGTDVNDIVSVEEQPAAGPRPAQYFVKLTSNDGLIALTRTWKEPLTAVPNRAIYFFGRNGNDNFSFKPMPGSPTRIFADGGGGADTMSGGPNSDFLDGGRLGLETDELRGYGGDDLLAGGGGNDFLWGEAGGAGTGVAGNDVLVGEGQADTMLGGSGHDALFGGAGVDTMDGDSGNDRVFGGTGADFVGGGGDNDYLDGGVDSDIDTLTGGPGVDTIMKRLKDIVNKDKDDKAAPGSVPL